MNDYEWRQQLKVGDEVVVMKHPAQWVATVTKITKTRINVDLGGRPIAFMKGSGREVGGSTWHSAHLYQTSQEKIEEIKLRQQRAKFAGALSRVNWKKYPLAFLEKVWGIVKEEVVPCPSTNPTDR